MDAFARAQRAGEEAFVKAVADSLAGSSGGGSSDAPPDRVVNEGHVFNGSEDGEEGGHAVDGRHVQSGAGMAPAGRATSGGAIASPAADPSAGGASRDAGSDEAIAPPSGAISGPGDKRLRGGAAAAGAGAGPAPLSESAPLSPARTGGAAGGSGVGGAGVQGAAGAGAGILNSPPPPVQKKPKKAAALPPNLSAAAGAGTSEPRILSRPARGVSLSSITAGLARRPRAKPSGAAGHLDEVKSRSDQKILAFTQIVWFMLCSSLARDQLIVTFSCFICFFLFAKSPGDRALDAALLQQRFQGLSHDQQLQEVIHMLGYLVFQSIYVGQLSFSLLYVLIALLRVFTAIMLF